MKDEKIKEKYQKWVDETFPVLEFSMEEISVYLNNSYALYSAMSGEELGEILFKLRQYAIYIKKSYNEEAARARWCYNHLLKVGKPLALNYESYDKDERFQSAIKESESLIKVQDVKIECDSKAQMLDGFDKSIGYLIVTLERLFFYKIEKGKVNGSEAKEPS